MTDPIDVSIGEAAPLGGRIFIDPLTFQRAILLVILVRRIPKQHIRRRIGRKRNTVKEKGRREEEYLIDLSDEIIKGVTLEFKCKLILTLSPIYNDDLQDCHFNDVRVATASPSLTASYPSRSLQIRSKQNITHLFTKSLLIFLGQLLGLDFYNT